MSEPTLATGDPEHGLGVMPWVLLDTLDPPERPGVWRVIAEGSQPRHRTRLERTRIAGSSTLAHALPAVIDAAVRTRCRLDETVHRPSGETMRVIAIPVTAGDTVLAVQAWAGPVGAPIPPAPVIGTLAWHPGSGGAAVTSPELERMIDSDRVTGGRRTLADLMGHLDELADRNGLLALFDTTTIPAVYWAGLAVTRGATSRDRRTLAVTAHRTGTGKQAMVWAVAIDVSVSLPPAPPPVAIRVLREIPVRFGHGVAVLDLKSGLIHEWVHPAPPPLDRWTSELPTMHPADAIQVDATRADLLAGTDHARTSWRLRFPADTDWTPVTVGWTILTRDGAPQAMLDIQRPRRTPDTPETPAGAADP